jgi:type III secretory pathway component EscS
MSFASGFFSGLGQSLDLFFGYVAISFLSSSAYLIVCYFIHNKLSPLFILFAPFLNVAVAVVIGILLNFILWVTELDEMISVFQKVFMIAAISTIGTTIWLLGDMFRNEMDS